MSADRSKDHPLPLPAQSAGTESYGFIQRAAQQATANSVSGERQAAAQKKPLSGNGRSNGYASLGSITAGAASATTVRTDRQRGLVVAFAGAATIITSAAIAMLIILHGGGRPQKSAASVGVASQEVGESSSSTGAARSKKAGVQSGEQEPVLSASAGDDEAAVDKELKNEKRRGRHRRGSGRRGRHRRGSGSRHRSQRSVASAVDQKTSEAVPPPVTTKRSTGEESLSELLSRAVDGKQYTPKKSRRSRKPSPVSDLPRRPSRDQVLVALRGVEAAVSACAHGKRGVAVANIVVAGSSGRVKSVRVSGIKGKEASCIARAVRKARFPRFSEETFSVKFPFRL